MSAPRPSKTRPRGWSWLCGTRTWSRTRRAWRRTSRGTSPSTRTWSARIPGFGKSSGVWNLIITHVLAESRSDDGKRKQYYALLKDRCLRRKYSPNVDKMLVESTGVLSFKFSESSRVQTSKLPQSKQSIVCDKLVPKDKQIGCKNCTNCFAKLAKLKSIEVCSKANCRAGLTETTYNWNANRSLQTSPARCPLQLDAYLRLNLDSFVSAYWLNCQSSNVNESLIRSFLQVCTSSSILILILAEWARGSSWVV